MQYNNSYVRRQDRLLEQESAIYLLATGEYGVLSLATIENEPYGIPLNYAWDGMNCIYFHCAVEGRKLELLMKNSLASFCVVGKTNVIPEKFSTGYESIIVKGMLRIGLFEEEKLTGLNLLVKKYSPSYQSEGQKYIEKLFHQTEVLRFDIQEVSGKSKVIR